jgi:16S rRNA (cytosine967-C5)-methyltransferase
VHIWSAMPDPTRDIAFDLLTAVLDRRRPLDEALDALPPAEPRDRAAGHRIAAAVLRRLGTLDAALDPLLKRAPPDPVRHILRIGTAGLLLLDTPPHAAVATAVSLARARGLAPFAGLVNAVLRRVAAQGAAALDDLDGPRLDTPPWLWTAWGARARAIAEAHQTEAPLDLTLRPCETAPEGAVYLSTGTARMEAGTRVAGLPGFEQGTFWVQDAAAALPARLLAACQGEWVADLCAAPGGKTAQLAATGAIVIAVERDVRRAARLRENLARVRLHAEVIEVDATRWQYPRQFDAILVDAPCSATGTIRRHPDIPHLKRASDLPALCEAQDRLLDAAVRLLRPGGRLVYAVCSLQEEEGPGRIAALLGRARLIKDPVRLTELPGLANAINLDGTVRTLPSMWREFGGMDGFYIARLRKPG